MVLAHPLTSVPCLDRCSLTALSKKSLKAIQGIFVMYAHSEAASSGPVP